MEYAKWTNYRVAEIIWQHHKIRYVSSGWLLVKYRLQDTLLNLLKTGGHRVFIHIDDSYKDEAYHICAPEDKKLLDAFLEEHRYFYEIEKLLGPLLQVHEQKTIECLYDFKTNHSFDELHNTLTQYPPLDSSHDDYYLEKYQPTNCKFPTYYMLCKGIYGYLIGIDVYEKLRSILFSMSSITATDRPYTNLSSNLHYLTDKDLLTILSTGQVIAPKLISKVVTGDTLEADDNQDDFLSSDEETETNEYYDDNLDMDQQSQEYWDNL